MPATVISLNSRSCGGSWIPPASAPANNNAIAPAAIIAATESV